MRGDRTVAFLIVIAFIGAVFAPCHPLSSAPVRSVHEAAGVSGQGGFFLGSNSVASEKGTRSNPAALTARCPCGCDERPAVAGSSPGLGIALISRAPSPAPLPGDQELCSVISFLPTSPPSGVDTVPRSA